MTTALGIAILLFVAAIVVFIIDLLIPSGGVLHIVSGTLAFGAIVFAFRHGQMAGLWMLLVALSSVPILMSVFLMIWPKTPIGRRMIVPPASPGEFVWSDAAKVQDQSGLIGIEGVAETDFLPSGKARIGDELFEAVSESGPIDRGKKIKVTRLDVGRLVVMEVRDLPTSRRVMSDGTGLDRPIDSLDLDSLN